MRAVAALAVAVALLGGLQAARAATGSTDRGTTVSTALTGLGRVLVDGRGRTLYLFEKDKHGKSACTGQCAGFWPPLIAASKAKAGTGVKSSLLGRTRRSDGRLQVTYDHHPLYTFAQDTRRGQTNGEGLTFFGGEWYAVSPAGAKVESAGPEPGGYPR